MKVTKKITIHLDDPRRVPPIDVMQGDAYTRQLEFSLYSGGEAWNVPDGVSVAVAYHGASGQGAYDTLQDDATKAYTVSGNVVTITLIPQVAAVPGYTTVSVVFTDTNGKQLTTFGVIIDVKRNPAIGAGTPENYYNLREWLGAGTYYIRIDDNAGYEIDEDYDSILQKCESGQAVAVCLGTAYDRVTLPFVKANAGGELYFSTVCDGKEWQVIITRNPEDGSAVVSAVSWAVERMSPEAGIRFRACDDKVTVFMRGSGTVRLFSGTNYQAVDLSENGCEVTMDNPTGTSVIDGVEGLTELDLHGQSVDSFTVETPCALRKLVIYDNNLQELDCSNLPNLQFLHFHNNPMCQDDGPLSACLRSLPNRSLVATGSIIFYPWYGLEVLIRKDAEGNYIKYPAAHAPLVFEEGRLYGVVENGSITYYTYTGGKLQLHTAMNRHHALRKQMERDVCLRKNWIFGSAIMYDEHDWAKCPWDFRYGHIADMWETAEKGFGLTWGSLDSFTNTLCGYEHFNVAQHRCLRSDNATEGDLPQAPDYTDPETAPATYYNKYISGNWTHGDNFLSMVAGNGEEANGEVQRFGYVPNSSCCLVDKSRHDSGGYTLDNIVAAINFLVGYCDTISLSTNLPTSYPAASTSTIRNALGIFGENGVYTNSVGNDGDGRPYTLEGAGQYANIGGKYTVDGVEKPSNAIFIGSVNPARGVSRFSSTNSDAGLMDAGRETYLCYYGEQLLYFANVARVWKIGSGTSDAAPLCCAMLLLMRIIYSKMFPNENSFGKYSNFMDHVRNRWCDHLEDAMDIAVGYGIPDILAEPYAPSLLATAPDMDCKDAAVLGDALNISYGAGRYAKQRYTPEQKMSSIAIAKDGKVYPLFAGKLDLKLYSNSARKEPVSFDENYYVSQISANVLPNVVEEVGGGLELVLDTLVNDHMNEEVVKIADSGLNSKKFTVQFALDFTDKIYPVDAGEYTTARDLLYFSNGIHPGYLSMTGIKYTTGDAYTNLNAAKFKHNYFDSPNGQLTGSVIGVALGKSLDMDVSTYGIVTMTCSESGIDYFFNGTPVGHIANHPQIDIKVSEVYVNKDSLCHDAVGCVRIYDRVLTPEEIIQNTIFMLNSHFEED